MTIGNRVRILRKEALSLTQEEFSKKIGISRSNLGNIETDTVALTERVLTAICTVFNVNEEWLRTGEGEMFEELSQDEELAEFLADIQKSDDADPVKQIILAFMKLSKEQQEDFKENLGAIIENLHK